MSATGANRKLDAVIKAELAKLSIAIALALGLLLLAEAFIFSYQSQNAVCEMFKTKVEQYGSPLGREIALGDTQVSGQIFDDFKQSIGRLGAKEDLRIDFVSNPTATLTKAACKETITSTDIFQPIYFGTQPVAIIHGRVRQFPSLALLGVLLLLGAGLSLIFKVLRTRIVRSLDEQIIKPITALSSGYTPEKLENLSQDVQEIAGNIHKLKLNLLNEQKKNLDLERKRQLSEIAVRVAHDIRSPISLIKVIADNDSGVTLENKRLLRMVSDRIEKIASNLLEKYKNEKTQTVVDIHAYLIVATIDKIVVEKRALHKDKNIDISLAIEPAAAKAFVEIDPIEIGRALSNLIENAVQANDKPIGNISIRGALEPDKKYLRLSVTDNGRGIPSDKLREVGEKGVTFDKPNGNGIGVYSAKALVESVGGKLLIRSEISVGTTVEMLLPVSVPPKWFAGCFNLPLEQEITVVDDDPSIYEFWKSKFPNVKQYYSEVSNDLVAALSDPNTFFLMDNQVGENCPTGIDLITQSKATLHSILVTQDFESKDLQAKCEAIGCKILPKVLFPYLDVSFTNPSGHISIQ